MKILLVGNYEPSRQKSMQRFAAMLDSGFKAAGHETRVIRPPVVAGRLPARGLAGKWLGYIDQFIVFPKFLEKAVDWADIVHICDHSNAFYVKYVRRRPHIVTCHDILAIRSALGEFVCHRTGWSGRRLQKMILKGLQSVGQLGHISCVSEATRRDLLRVSGVPVDNVSRIYNGLNFPYSPLSTDRGRATIEKFGISKSQRFILHVGGNDWYKNRIGVLQIFSAFKSHLKSRDVFLVMAGQPLTKTMRIYLKNGNRSDVIQVINPSNEELRALYSAADLLLFPSLQEGFGWPIIEAQACGCPVITSNRAPMTEVGGAAATYIDPEDISTAATVIAETIQVRDAACKKSLNNVERFRAPQMIEQYLVLQERLVSSK
jgi:glycosyltransferase involved in cell wall biosynthesis